MPLIVYFLTKVGIVSAEGLLRYWRHCIFGVFLLSAIITPSGDPAGMLALAVPLTALFFASVFAAKWSNKKALQEDDPLNNLD